MTDLREHAQLNENCRTDWLVNERALISDWWSGSLRYPMPFNFQ